MGVEGLVLELKSQGTCWGRGHAKELAETRSDDAVRQLVMIATDGYLPEYLRKTRGVPLFPPIGSDYDLAIIAVEALGYSKRPDVLLFLEHMYSHNTFRESHKKSGRATHDDQPAIDESLYLMVVFPDVRGPIANKLGYDAPIDAKITESSHPKTPPYSTIWNAILRLRQDLNH